MSEWKDSQIKDFGRVITGYTPPTNNLNLWDGDIPFYSPTDFNDGVYCFKTERTINNEAISNDRVVKKNSLMVTCIASIGKISLATKTGITNQQINSILFNDKFDPRYCYYLIKHNISKLIKLGGTTAVPIINKADFEKIYLRHHSDIDDQRQIAHILSTVDVVIEKTQAAIAKYKAVKQGMLQDLFTRGIDLQTGKLRPRFEEAPHLYKESKLGWIPKGWEVKDIFSIGQVLSGATPSTEIKEFWDGDITWISPADLSKQTDLIYFSKSQRKITEKGFQNCSAVLVPANSLVISSRAPIGYLSIVLEPYTTNQGCKSVNFNSGEIPEFYYYNLLQNIDRLKGLGAGTTFAEIGKAEIERFNVLSCSEKEQKIISVRLKAIDTKILIEQSFLEKMQSLKKGLMEDLLSGKVRVKVE